MTGCERYKTLLMGLMDDELTPEESQDIHTHLTKCQSCRNEYEQLKSVGAKIGGVSFEEPEDAALASLWKSPYSRFSRSAGLFMAVAGWVILLVYAIVEFLKDGETPVIPKIAGAAMWIGLALLLVTVIRERIKTYKVDPYREVKR